MHLDKYTHIYLIGIGGIGMSALARYFKSRNLNVLGYDKTPTALTRKLAKEGIEVIFDEGINFVPNAYKNIEKTLVIFTPAVPPTHHQLLYFQSNGFDVFKRARILAEIANTGKNIAVAGTHGKTTTSSLVAHIFNAEKNIATAFLGGIAKNFNSNFVAGKTDTVVLEADEFDRSFHQLHPDIALITSTDADHLDIYGDEKNIEAAFQDFAQRIKPDGQLIVKHGLQIEGTTYGLTPEAEFYADQIAVRNGEFHFTLHTPEGKSIKTKSGLPGKHNVENAVGAAAICLSAGISLQKVAGAIASFEGVLRRFDRHIRTENCVYIDDYAHHPKEIEACLNAVSELYPGKKITAIFQPHLFSRTRDFANEFAIALSKANQLWLMEIYPARENPIPGVTANWLLEKIEMPHKKVCTREEIFDLIKSEKPEVLVTMGAGNIDQLVDPIIDILTP